MQAAWAWDKNVSKSWNFLQAEVICGEIWAAESKLRGTCTQRLLLLLNYFHLELEFAFLIQFFAFQLMFNNKLQLSICCQMFPKCTFLKCSLLNMDDPFPLDMSLKYWIINKMIENGEYMQQPLQSAQSVCKSRRRCAKRTETSDRLYTVYTVYSYTLYTDMFGRTVAYTTRK